MRRVILLGTGGTIACDPARLPLSPVRSAAELLTFLPSSPAVTAYDFPRQIDSTEMTPAIWLQLGETARELLSRADALIITHGTDTLAYTSSLFSYWFSGADKPILFTGSQYPMGMPGGDAEQNLSLALRAAQTAPPGVYVAFGGQLLPGCRVTKADTQSFQAFEAPNGAGGSCENAAPGSQGPTALAENVLFLSLAPGMSPHLVPTTLNGLVLAVYGAGGLPKDWARAAAGWSFPTVLVSQCRRGGLALSRYAVGDAARKAGVLDGGDMTVEAAYTKLLWLLGRGFSETALKKAFESNLCGERGK